MTALETTDSKVEAGYAHTDNVARAMLAEEVRPDSYNNSLRHI